MIHNDVRSKTSGCKSSSINMIKLNSNGASKDHIMVGCDGVIRDTGVIGWGFPSI